MNLGTPRFIFHPSNPIASSQHATAGVSSRLREQVSMVEAMAVTP